MSNIVYGMQVIPPEDDDDNKKVLDYNELLDERILEEVEKQNKEAAKEQARLAREEKIRELQEAEPQYDEDGNLIEPELPDDFNDELPEEEFEEPVQPDVDYIAEAKAEAENILEEARQQAQEILDMAQSQADAMKSHAEADGQQAGFDKGYQEALIKKTELEQEIQQQKADMEAAMAEKESNMERELVDAICQVVEKVFLVEFGDKKELIFHLLDNVISNVDSSQTFIIRVNENNMEFLRNKKEELQTKVGQEVTLDIVLDPLLDDSQCMVETDGGLFDCSMDTEMKNLIKEIKILS
ncbi:MAG: hypothetical protein K6B67_01700 [Lachnospiraceae bacterium]|nr:hypothetical protein [Lachnospiraceae bacterium]